jgi:hypothetical protein
MRLLVSDNHRQWPESLAADIGSNIPGHHQFEMFATQKGTKKSIGGLTAVIASLGW